MKFLKFAVVAMVAAAVSGCGSKVKVPEGTVAAAYLQADKAVETLVDSAKDVVGDLPDSLKKMTEAEKFLKEEVLKVKDEYDKHVKINWVLLGALADEKNFSSKVDEYIVANVKIKDMKEFDAMVKDLKETKIGEARAWQIPAKGFLPLPNEILAMAGLRNANLHIGLLEEKFVLAANSEEQLKMLVDLYSGNGKESSDFKDITELDGDAFFKVAVKPVGALLQNSSFKEKLAKVASVSGDQELLEALYGVKRVVVQAGVKYGLSGATLTVEAGTSAAADFFESLFNVGKFFLRGYTDWTLYEAVRTSSVPLEDLAKYGKLLRDGVEVDRSGTDVSFKTFINTKDMLRFGLKDFENVMK